MIPDTNNYGNKLDKINLLDLNVPIYKGLDNYIKNEIIPFHMPGHKMGKGFNKEFVKKLVKFDLTEIPGIDNLHFPEGIIREAQELAAKAFGSDKTFFLVNGSSCGIHAAIMSVLMPDERILVSRECHRSVIGGIMMAGGNPVYISPEFDPFFGIPTTLSPLAIEKALIENPDVKAVILTRPNYYGVCSDIKKIADITHSHNKILIVDEAHGAHLRFNKHLPISAIDGGADISIQSAHKTLPAFTQGAYLHVKSSIVDIEKIEFYLRLIQTTSPSYIIMTSLDLSRGIMEYYGENILDDLIANTEWIKGALDKTRKYVSLRENLVNRTIEDEGAAENYFDKTKLTLNTRRLGRSGYEVYELLREKFFIQAEMADMFNIVCICTISDNREDFKVLYQALIRLVEYAERKRMDVDFYTQTFNELPIPKQKVRLCDISKRQGKLVSLKQSIGKASRDFIVPYPPGIPVICPGEIIMKEIVEYIFKISELGGKINGIAKGHMINIIV